MGLVRMFGKKKTKKAPLPKLGLLVTVGGENKHGFALMTPHKYF